MVGAGVEEWLRSIQHDDVEGTARWASAVVTVGGGHIWRFAGDFFVDPWVGAHAVLDPHAVPLGPYRYTPFPLQAECSVRIGWFVSL